MIIQANNGFFIVRRYKNQEPQRVPVIGWDLGNDRAAITPTEVVYLDELRNWQLDGQPFLMGPDGRIETARRVGKGYKVWESFEAFVNDPDFKDQK